MHKNQGMSSGVSGSAAAYENNGLHSTATSDIFLVMIAGVFLCFGGTAVSYIWYTASAADLYSARRWPLPIVTDMFGDWPLVSCATMGLGTTLLFTGLVATAIARIPFEVGFRPRTVLVYTAIAAQASVWIVIPSSKNYGALVSSGIVGWIHEGSTLVFMVSSVWGLYTVYSICDFFVEALQQRNNAHQPLAPLHRRATGWTTPFVVHQYGGNQLAWERAAALQPYVTACNICVWLAGIGVVGATITVACIAFIDDRPTESYIWQAFVVSELMILLFTGVGYVLAIYTYSEIEAVASMAVSAMRQMNSTVGKNNSSRLYHPGVFWH